MSHDGQTKSTPWEPGRRLYRVVIVDWRTDLLLAQPQQLDFTLFGRLVFVLSVNLKDATLYPREKELPIG